jgi:hypothetical protein
VGEVVVSGVGSGGEWVGVAVCVTAVSVRGSGVVIAVGVLRLHAIRIALKSRGIVQKPRLVFAFILGLHSLTTFDSINRFLV